uniref:Uncharacterized protein n=1 Tax=Timema shepardi TaxID=629360 RepID=A0A7R9ARE8_TIMSH|nr:unnamed protein product [Timema shepardi]
MGHQEPIHRPSPGGPILRLFLVPWVPHLPTQHHGGEALTPQSNCGGVMTTNPQLAVTPANPLAMPVFPLRPTPSPYSPYSPSRFHIDKRCQHRCSWKCCSIALILLSVALTAMLAYFGGEYIVID